MKAWILVSLFMFGCGGVPLEEVTTEDGAPAASDNLERVEGKSDLVSDALAGGMQWAIPTPATSPQTGEYLVSGAQHGLFNLINYQFLGSTTSPRAYGIDLVWYSSRNMTHNTFIMKASGGLVLNCDTVALKFSPRGYIAYGTQSYGINLRWSSEPIYEWRIWTPFKDCGQPLRTGARYDRVGLINAKIERYMVYGSRTYGINLVWK